MTELKALTILKQEKNYQASFEYPDYKRISELNEAIAELEALQLRLLDAESYFHGVHTVKAPKTCDGCMFENAKYVNMCDECIRNDHMEDRYEPKDK